MVRNPKSPDSSHASRNSPGSAPVSAGSGTSDIAAALEVVRPDAHDQRHPFLGALVPAPVFFAVVEPVEFSLPRDDRLVLAVKRHRRVGKRQVELVVELHMPAL